MEQQAECTGLKSSDAYAKLRDVILLETKENSQSCSLMQICQDMYDAFHENQNMPINWFGIGVLLICGGTLFCGYKLDDKNIGHSTLFESIMVILSALLVIIFLTREQSLKRTEVVLKVQRILKFLEDSTGHWSSQSYPSLDEPSSNAVKMVWTYRDQLLVNLPWNLLVEGDVILLGPSHTAPAYVKQLVSNSKVQVCLDAGEVFNPPCGSTKDGIEEGSEPGQCQPHPRETFIVMETPIRRFLRGAFQKGARRPQSVLNSDMKKVCHLMRTKVFWGVIIIGFFVNYIRWRIFPDSVGHYAEVLLVAPVYAVLPLIPLSFPFLWILTTFYGTARIRALFSMSLEEFSSEEGDEDFATKLEHIPCQKVLSEFFQICYGNPESLSRTANLLHSLGSTSTLCCADKEGILCFPNPIPEKVFILRKSSTMGRSYTDSDDGITFMAAKENSVDSREDNTKDTSYAEEPEAMIDEHQPEVLTLSFDPTDPFGVCFDDANWKLHLDSLKPLGINVLMNSPCSSPYRNAQIEDFTGHISLGANNSPLPNVRRCLCLLAQTVGFDQNVMANFTKLAQVTTFRPVHAVELTNVRSNFFLSIIREKQVPSMVSVLTADKLSGVIQLFTQGSAEMVLDACSDFWDGDELCEISSEDRKNALDFYHRMNITGHCIAFSYRPVFEFSTNLIDNSVFVQYPSAIPISPTEDGDETGSNWSFSQHVEESLSKEQEEKVNGVIDCDPFDLTRHTSSCADLQPVAGLLKKQIFVGMVTLQDLVKEDIATLVEELGRGGIRFVHFSYENELRSRVFAERLGLETGWNCHISLAECNEQVACDKESTASDASEVDPLLNTSSNATLEYRAASKSQSCDVDVEGDDDDDADDDGYGGFFFISNRAKLPRGIKNIRPHLEKVDDVPLLVPLFTDCTPQTIREMISIMQDYGETVCCLGSALNVNNADIFSQADVRTGNIQALICYMFATHLLSHDSVAVDPLHPQQCLLGKADNFRCGSPPVRKKTERTEGNGYMSELKFSPLNLAAELTGIPCSLACHRNDKIKFVHLICEARRIMVGLRNAFHFLFCCCLSISIMMILSFCILLPFPLSGCQLLWLLLVILPMLSVSLIGTPAEGEVMQRMPGKKISDMKESTRQFLVHFCPTFLVNACFCVVVLFPWTLYSICHHNKEDENQCKYFSGKENSTEPWSGYGDTLRGAIIIGQEINLFFLIIYFVIFSISYVHRVNPIWKKSPFLNKPWWVTVLACLALQILYSTFSLLIRGLPLTEKNPYSLLHVNFGVFIVGFLWPPVILALSELTKKKFIRRYKRYQRRERLKFDTKLGMNSPV